MDTKRRDFLLSAALALSAASAYSFGESLKPLMESETEKIALIYGTKYGATRETAQWIAAGVGNAVALFDVETLDFNTVAQQYDRFIIGSGILIDGAHRGLMKLLAARREQMESRIIAAFIVCGTTGEDEAGQKRIARYFERFLGPLEVKPPMQAHFGGRMIIEKLTEADRKLLANFYKNIVKKPFESWDRTDPGKAKAFGVGLRESGAVQS